MMPSKFTPITWLFTVIFLTISVSILGQNASSDHSLFLLSNLERLSADAPEFDAIESVLAAEKGAFTILVNGDFIDKNGLEVPPEPLEVKKLDRLIALAGERGEIIFIPGDREWDNGRKKGLKKVKALEEYLEAKIGKGKVLFPHQGCLGPEVLDIGDHLRIVAVNTQWFVQEDKRPDEEDTDCSLLNEFEFWDELGDALTDSENRNIVVATHHPALSYGQYAGYKLIRQHFSPPIIGSMIAAYHQNIGTRKDLNHQSLKNFSQELLKKAEQHPGAIFVSGHEYDLQILEKDGNYHINSGAVAKARPVARGKETLFKQRKPGFAQLIFAENGAVDVHVFTISGKKQAQKSYEKNLFASPCETAEEDIPINTLYNPCQEIDSEINANAANQPRFGTAVAGAQYKAGKLKQFIWGKHYRSTWITPVNNIPYLDLDTLYGGLTPYAKGGAAQTLSLKFKSGDGQRFALRSIDKKPTKRMDKDLVAGVYGDLVQDLTSHQHPYASGLVASLMDQLDLPHSMPKLYLIPDDPKLGPFRKEFAGKFGWLELKPKGKKKGRQAFREADKVVSTVQMYRKLLDDNDNKVAVQEYVTARIFDMWISDWDRHVNNWKWLAYDNGKGLTFKPFPKDRDKALSVLNGVYWLSDLEFITHDKANFKDKYRGLKSLNFKNKSMDRWLANASTYEDWMLEAKRIQGIMTDEVIENAIATMPPEVQGLTRDRIMRVLKNRRADLPKAIEKYYAMLAKYIDLVGSNSREFFELTRLKSGDVQVVIYKLKKSGKKGKKLYERLIKKSETKEIRLHGLGKKDQFVITGETNKSILIRIIGGNGKDVIEDRSKVRGSRKMTKVYDKKNKDVLTLNSEGKKVKTPEEISFKTEGIFNYDYFYVLPSLSFNQDDGLTFGLNGKSTKQGFNKPDFSRKINFQAAVTTRRNYDLGFDAQFRHVLDKWDLVTGVDLASRDKSFRRFYGSSNENVFDEDLDDAGFYRNKTATVEAYLGFSRMFWNKSSFTASAMVDYKNVRPDPKRRAIGSIYDGLPPNNGLGETTLLGPQVALDIDFRDHAAFPTKGMQFKARNYTFFNSDLDWNLGGQIQSELSAFITKGIKIPTTLSLRGGVATTYGDTPFYYKNYLGQQGNHRGFLRNRFGGETVAFLNTDLRFHFGTWVSPLVPIKYGIFGLFDIGRAWSEGEDSDVYHSAFGGGIYVIPYSENFNLNFTVAQSDDRDLLFSFRIGFFVK